jgi:hypothetical protein
MALLDELGAKNGEADRVENRDYLQRTLGILTQLRGELYPYSDTYEDGIGGGAVRAGYSGRAGYSAPRPIAPAIADLDAPLGLDDFLCQTLMPCALAARLVLDENPPVSAYYERKYQELLARRIAARAREFEQIPDIYGGLRVENEGSLWP